MLKWILAVVTVIVGGLTLCFLVCVLTVIVIMARWADHRERLNLCHVMEKHAQRERKTRRLQLLRQRRLARKNDWTGQHHVALATGGGIGGRHD